MIEILVVLSIIAIILALLSPTLFRLAGRGDVTETRALLVNISASLKAYATNPDYGVFPPTVLDETFLKVPKSGRFKPNDTNLGIESLVFHLTHEDYVGESPFSEEERFINTDDDEASVALTWTGDKALFEYADAWGNPLIYFNLADLTAGTSQQFRVTTLEGAEVSVSPAKSSKFKNSFAGRSDGFQIISLGPDGEFDTKDDIHSWSVTGSSSEIEDDEENEEE